MYNPAYDNRTLTSSQPGRRTPRRNRWGGFVMKPDVAGAWASRLLGEELHPYYDFHTICKVVLKEVRSYQVNFRLIRETWPNEALYMLITQSAKFENGYKGMNPSDFPHFKEGEREDKIQSFLCEQGGFGNLGFECIWYNVRGSTLRIHNRSPWMKVVSGVGSRTTKHDWSSLTQRARRLCMRLCIIGRGHV